MHTRHLLAALLATACAGASAQTPPPSATAEPVIVPSVERKPIKLPRIPSNDIEIGLFTGTYATQNFGAESVSGVRLGYHITEDIFVVATYGQSKVSDEAFRQVLPGGVFVDKTEKLTYYNLSAGYNVLPGEVFFGKSTAKASALYLIAGTGSTTFNKQKKQTLNAGFGVRLMVASRFSLQLDVRDHVFALDLLGKRQSTQNLEVTGGLAVYF